MNDTSENSPQVIKESNIKMVYGYIIGIVIFIIIFNYWIIRMLQIDTIPLSPTDRGLIIFISNSPFIFIIFPLMINFYRWHGTKMISVSNKKIEIDVPLKSLKTIRWSDFDRMMVNVRGPKGLIGEKELTKFKIKFLRNHTVKHVKFAYYDNSKASQILKLIIDYADKINKFIDVKTKYFYSI